MYFKTVYHFEWTEKDRVIELIINLIGESKHTSSTVIGAELYHFFADLIYPILNIPHISLNDTRNKLKLICQQIGS